MPTLFDKLSKSPTVLVFMSVASMTLGHRSSRRVNILAMLVHSMARLPCQARGLSRRAFPKTWLLLVFTVRTCIEGVRVGLGCAAVHGAGAPASPLVTALVVSQAARHVPTGVIQYPR